jgi:hypothetical protein
LKYLFSLLLLSQICAAQQSGIYGMVKDKNSGEPVLFAHIYLANTTRGTTSDTNGNFVLENIPEGQFTLVCTMVGYDPYTKDINLRPGRPTELMIEMMPSVNMLNEIELVDKEDKKWRKKFEEFKRELLGDMPNADHCEIINPWVVNFENDRRFKNIRAHADQPIIIHNKALGYKLGFLLIRFEKEIDRLFYLGYPNFDTLSATDSSSLENIKKNREETYRGSIRHFFYALVNDKLEDEGFLLYNIANGFEHRGIESLQGAIDEHIFKPTNVTDIIHDSNPWGNHTIYTSGALEVIYTKKSWKNSPYWDAPYQVSRIIMNDKLVVSKNGYVFNPFSFIVYGYLSEERLANMLPFEYGLDTMDDHGQP